MWGTGRAGRQMRLYFSLDFWLDWLVTLFTISFKVCHGSSIKHRMLRVSAGAHFQRLCEFEGLMDGSTEFLPTKLPLKYYCMYSFIYCIW